MNEKRLNQLFGAARRETATSPEAGFASLVLTTVRREAQACEAGPVSWLDQIGALFPRLAWATALVVALCVAADFGLSVLGVPSLTDGMAQISNQWLLTANGF